jgi:hypothetical protein
MKNIFLVLIALCLLVCTVQATWSTAINTTDNNVFYNQSYSLDQTNSVPWEIWWASGLIGLGMFLLTLRARTTAMELEVDAIISATSLVPIAFCAWASLNIDRITGYGVTSQGNTYVLMVSHTLYSFPVIAVLVACLFIATLGNLFRILAQHKLFAIQTVEPPSTAEPESPSYGYLGNVK